MIFAHFHFSIYTSYHHQVINLLISHTPQSEEKEETRQRERIQQILCNNNDIHKPKWNPFILSSLRLAESSCKTTH